MKIKSLGLLLLTFVLLGLNSCKKETVDVTHLLSTVPSSASGVVVFNMEGLLEDAGCKIKDHVIEPSKEVKDLISKASEQDKKYFMMLFDGNTGIEPKGAVVFYDSNRTFLTFALYDVNKFCDFINEINQGSFTDEGSGVKVNGNVAVKGAQAWICLSSGKRIDADAIASYSSLKDSQSFLVSKMGEELLVAENDIRGWGMFGSFMNGFMSPSERNMFTLGIGFLFNDAEAAKFKVDFKKGEMEAEMIMLTEEGKVAKYLLPAEKIDVNTLKSLGGTCDAMMAFTLNSKMIKKFEQVGAALGGSLFGNLGETFKNVDGTVGIVASGEGMGESYNGVITTKGDINPMLRDLISKMVAPVSQDGKFLRFSKGDVKGSLSVEECAEELKGCCLGFVVDATGIKSIESGPSVPQGFKSVIVKLDPESGGLEMEMEIKTQNPKDNALLVLLRSEN